MKIIARPSNDPPVKRDVYLFTRTTTDVASGHYSTTCVDSNPVMQAFGMEHCTEKHVLVIYTGGTIGMVHDSKGALVPVPNVLPQRIREISQMHDPYFMDDVKRSQFEGWDSMPLVLPGQTGQIRVLYWIKELTPLLDSSNISFKDWLHIAAQIKENYDDYDGFVILHGTDTLAYTASALSFLFKNLSKTVIVTGSQVPIFEVTNDGLNNFLSSVTIAAHHIIPEVTVFFGDKLFRGNRTVKFCSVNCEGAFDSPNCDPLATYDISLNVNSQQIQRPHQIETFAMHTKLSCNVVLLKIFPGIQADMVREFLKSPVEGAVLETYGAGNIPDRWSELAQALAEATARRVIIVNCTQCIRGAVCAIYATSQALINAGVIPGRDMTSEAALTKLSVVLAVDEWDLNTKRHMMGTNLRGELTTAEEATTFDVNFNAVIKSCLKMSITREMDQIRSVFFPAAMCQAAADGNVKQCLELERKGGDYFRRNADGRTPLHVACAAGHLAVVRLALSRGASLHVRDRFNKTPLDEAIDQGHMDIVRALVVCGARLQPDAIGDAVCRATSRGDMAALQAFRLAGVTLNEKDAAGHSPIHLAILKRNYTFCRYLHDCGVDMTTKDAFGRTPLDYARIFNFKPFLDLLQTRD